MRNTIVFIIGLLLAIWFLLTSWYWVYLLNLIYSYPAGILAIVCWLIISDDKKWRNRLIPIVTGVGLLISLTVLICLLITN